MPSLLSGCAGSPRRTPPSPFSPRRKPTARSRTSGGVVKLEQENQQFHHHAHQGHQDTGDLRNQIKEMTGNLTQEQFRLESWLAGFSGHLGLRLFGGAAFVPAEGFEAATWWESLAACFLAAVCILAVPGVPVLLLLLKVNL